ncbi:MAG: hypothetical protein KAR45_18800 [Desulfobacteraceae bacterium]|nr:hypothetical protein [Desulfobacteraceae bacterium]
MKTFLINTLDYILFVIHKITNNKQALEYDFLKKENKILKRMLKDKESKK